MTEIDERLHELLHEIADEARPAPFLVRMDRRGSSVRRLRRLAAVGTVVAAALAVVVVSTHAQHTSAPLPADQPPTVFRLAQRTLAAPGPANLAVVLAAGHVRAEPVHLVPATGRRTVALTASTRFVDAGSTQLSADGTRIARRTDDSTDSLLEVVNLATGWINALGGTRGDCPQLSPDDRTLAFYTAEDVRLLDISSMRTRVVSHVAYPADPVCSGLGWSPDGASLVIGGPQTSVIVDRRGHVQARLGSTRAVNGSQSWSPDGRALLVYDAAQATFAVRETQGDGLSPLTLPPDATAALGWAGSRVVWLAGQPGAQRLVTTDRVGHDERSWMRFDIGDHPIENVTWSRALSG